MFTGGGGKGLCLKVQDYRNWIPTINKSKWNEIVCDSKLIFFKNDVLLSNDQIKTARKRKNNNIQAKVLDLEKKAGTNHQMIVRLLKQELDMLQYYDAQQVFVFLH
jgi:hypothetical protein